MKTILVAASVLFVTAVAVSFAETETRAVDASSGSDVSADDLRARTVSPRLSSGSDAEVYATDQVDIEARSGSDVTVSCNPATRNVDADRSSDVHFE